MNDVSAILNGLNGEQEAAVKCVEGPVLIVAGAGSGKTRVLTSRIAYMLAKGTEPSGVMALTFTKKAASEMKERIAKMVGERSARRLVMGTFHSVFIRFLREYSDYMGYPKSFTIYDTSDSVSAIKTCLKELKLDDKIYKPKDVLSRISQAKNNLFTAASYRSNPNATNQDAAARKPRICDIYALYEKKCRDAGVMDFDDILLNMNILLRDNGEAAENISSRFTHLLVDEYQDTNFAQYVILKRLARIHHNICVVGDDSQSIYAFRGANIKNILNFRTDYPESKIFRLERNYRSTRNIVDAANSLIEKNSGRIPKKCYSAGEEGDKIRLLRPYTEAEEASIIASDIVARMQKDKAPYRDFAILYRTNAQSRIIEEILRKRNLPYIIYSGNSFFERAEVKDMMAYFKLAVNPNDDEAFKRIVNTPARGIGETSMKALADAASAHGCPLFKALYLPDLEVYGLKAAAIAKLHSFGDMVNKWAIGAASEDAFLLAQKIADDSTLLSSFRLDNSVESLARAGNVEELINSVASFVDERTNEYMEEMEFSEAGQSSADGIEPPVVTLGEFLENISLLSNVDVEEDEDGSNKIAMMTVHSAKGLEYKYVYIAGMEEKLFPSEGMSARASDLEEERRLLYVAITRAKKAVAVSFAKTRMRNGDRKPSSPSRFLGEIDQAYFDSPLTEEDLHNQGAGGFAGASGGRFSAFGNLKKFGMGGQTARPGGASKPFPRQETVQKSVPKTFIPPKAENPDFVPSPIADFREGQRVEHVRFGRGSILSLDGQEPETRALVRFEEYGEKTIILRYRKMRIL